MGFIHVSFLFLQPLQGLLRSPQLLESVIPVPEPVAMVPLLGVMTASPSYTSDMAHHLSLRGFDIGDPTLPGFSRCRFQMSAARLDNTECWGRKSFLPVIHSLLALSVGTPANRGKI